MKRLITIIAILVLLVACGTAPASTGPQDGITGNSIQKGTETVAIPTAPSQNPQTQKTKVASPSAATPTPVPAQEQQIRKIAAQSLNNGYFVDLVDAAGQLGQSGFYPGEPGSPTQVDIILPEYLNTFGIPEGTTRVNREDKSKPIELLVNGFQIFVSRADGTPVTYGEVTFSTVEVQQ